MIISARFNLIAFLLATFLIGALPTNAQAQSWDKYRDEDGLFHVLIPENYKIKEKTLRVSDNQVVISKELTASVDQSIYKKNAVKQYIVKYDQTFSHMIDDKQIPQLINVEVGKYIDYYTAYGGVVREKKIASFAGYPGAELIISFRDKERGLQGIRARIMFSSTTKVEQIVIGPEDSMFSHRTKDFFGSLRLEDGRTALEGDFIEEWEAETSPFQLSSNLIPPRADPYVPSKVKVVNTDRVERMSMKFLDPVFNYTLFYNIYGYRFGTLLTTENVQKVIMDKHLKKFKVNIAELKFAATSKGKYPVLSTKMHFASPEKYPYMNTIRINAYYFGNFLAIQEMVGNNIHVESSFGKNLQRYYKFHPIKAHDQLQKEKAEMGMERLHNETESDDIAPPEDEDDVKDDS